MTAVDREVDVEAQLRAIVERLVRERGEPTVRRYRRVLTHLLLFLDRVDAREPLGPFPAARLEAARDVGREGAFFRCFGLTEVVACLPWYLDDAWLAVQRQERTAQLRVVAAVARRARAEGTPDLLVATALARVAVVRTSDGAARPLSHRQ